jgi:2-polyprenyl-6-methoxyphenol hydroxylase-like FAD-dependent oxidoreductase
MLAGPIAGVHICGRPGHSGQFIAVTGGLLPGAGIREFRDAVRHRPGRAGVAPSVCVRPSLVLNALGTGQKVRRGVGVVRVDTSPHRPHVALSDGSEEVFDLVVGADGVHSTVRGAVVTTTPRASVMTTASWRFVVPNPGVDCWTAWTGGGLALLLIPLHAGEAYGYASSSKGGAAGADPAWLAQAFARFPTPARRAVEAASERGRAPYHSPVEEIRIDTWHRGPVVLVGDAAHATGPVWAQGAAALEDALVLAEMLVSRSDWTAAVSGLGTTPPPSRRPRTGGDGPDVAPGQASRLSISQPGSPRWPRAYRAAYGPLRERP